MSASSTEDPDPRAEPRPRSGGPPPSRPDHLSRAELGRRLGLPVWKIWSWEEGRIDLPEIEAHHLEPVQRAVFSSGRIREARHAARLSQRALARALGVDRSLVSRWENGERVPSEPLTEALRALLGLEP